MTHFTSSSSQNNARCLYSTSFLKSSIFQSKWPHTHRRSFQKDQNDLNWLPKFRTCFCCLLILEREDRHPIMNGTERKSTSSVNEVCGEHLGQICPVMHDSLVQIIWSKYANHNKRLVVSVVFNTDCWPIFFLIRKMEEKKTGPFHTHFWNVCDFNTSHRCTIIY